MCFFRLQIEFLKFHGFALHDKIISIFARKKVLWMQKILIFLLCRAKNSVFLHCIWKNLVIFHDFPLLGRSTWSIDANQTRYGGIFELKFALNRINHQLLYAIRRQEIKKKFENLPKSVAMPMLPNLLISLVWCCCCCCWACSWSRWRATAIPTGIAPVEKKTRIENKCQQVVTNSHCFERFSCFMTLRLQSLL